MKNEMIFKFNTALEAICEYSDNIKNLQVLNFNDTEFKFCIEFHDVSHMEWRVYGIIVEHDCVTVLYVDNNNKHRVEIYKYSDTSDMHNVIVAVMEDDDKVLEKHKK